MVDLVQSILIGVSAVFIIKDKKRLDQESIINLHTVKNEMARNESNEVSNAFSTLPLNPLRSYNQ
jgi:hypothetical protein